MVGSPAYMSPEQARGAKVDPRTDLFSLGAVLYRLCTGEPPFAAPNVMAVLWALGNEEPVPVRERNPNVPEPLAALIHQLLAKNPDHRPQTAADVAKWLRMSLEKSVAAPAAGPTAGPTAAGGNISTSLPVVVHPLPVQPPAVVPMQITTRPASAFYDLDEDDAPETGRGGSDPKRRRAGGKSVLIAAGVAVLLAAVAGVIVVTQLGKKGSEAKAPEGGPPGDRPGTKAGPETAKPGGPLPATFKNAVGMEFVLVPKGTGWLGGGAGTSGGTRVVIERDFYLGTYEVTQEEWEAVMGVSPSTFRPGSAAVKDVPEADLKRFPVEGVSWDDCQSFIDRLNNREKEPGWVYRLPREAEWEYACRGGPAERAGSAFDFYLARPTNTLLPDQANFDSGKERKRTCKVGSYQPNSLGLYDMHGNVWEWCEDSEKAGGVAYRMTRGGSWFNYDGYCRAANGHAFVPSYQGNHLGLRLARVPSVPAGK